MGEAGDTEPHPASPLTPTKTGLSIFLCLGHLCEFASGMHDEAVQSPCYHPLYPKCTHTLKHPEEKS